MQPHPDFADTALPRHVELGAFRLTPLTTEHTEEDCAAVMSSAPVLTGVFGTWPDGMTLEENRIDLAWHDREFTLNRSFSWIIRDAGDTYLGCFYVFPDPGTRGTAQAVIWIKAHPQRDATARTVIPRLQSWAAAHLPEHVTLRWTLSPEVTSET